MGLLAKQKILDKHSEMMLYYTEQTVWKLNIEEYLSTIVSVKSPEWKVVSEELAEFKKRKMYPLLQFLVYLVDFMRDNKIVWGVGRGSSVASFCLFLIGVHKINPIQYNIDHKEFLR